MGKLGVLFVFMLGFLAYAGMNLFFKETNTLEFCTSCHTMQQNLTEYKETIHYKNHAGVRAICSDCHVPSSKHPVAKIWAKVYAAKDVWHEIIGTIDTPEKFEQHRWEMANRVWDKMKKTDSRECRTCHSWDAMMFSEQDKSASKQHQRAKKEGKTCIDCHKGIAHEEPDEPQVTAKNHSENANKNNTQTNNDQQSPNINKDEKTRPVDTIASTTAAIAPPIQPSTPRSPKLASTDATDAGPLTDLVNGCNKCHGKDGNSQENEVPNIAKASTIYLHDALMAFKSGDRIGDEFKNNDGKVTDMNKLTADLSEDQISKLAEYYSAKSLVAHSQNANLAMADEGSKLFDKKCEKCHSDGGTNPDDDAGIIAGQPKAYLLKQFKHFEDGKREMPRKMARKFKKLSTEQKQAIIEFLIK